MNDVFIAIDGNGVGKTLERLILCECFDELQAFSARVSRSVRKVAKHLRENGGRILMAGGDNVLAVIPVKRVEAVRSFVDCLESADLNFSIGVGADSKSSYLALKYAKATQHGCVCCRGGRFIVADAGARRCRNGL